LTPASGRQDHTILPSALVSLVLRRHPRPRIPLHVRDDAYAPLVEAGRAEGTTISDFRKENIFGVRTDNPNQLESPQEIDFCAHAIWRAFLPCEASGAHKIALICPAGANQLHFRISILPVGRVSV
jgi:hypothetical protein